MAWNPMEYHGIPWDPHQGKVFCPRQWHWSQLFKAMWRSITWGTGGETVGFRSAWFGSGDAHGAHLRPVLSGSVTLLWISRMVTKWEMFTSSPYQNIAVEHMG